MRPTRHFRFASPTSLPRPRGRWRETDRNRYHRCMQENAATSRWRALLYRARELGPLRLGLLFFAVLAIVLMPAPGTPAVYSGWPLVRTVLVPVLAPFLFLVLLLDALMARVFLTDAEGAARRRYKTAIIINLLAAAILLIRWLPHFAALQV